jgi:flagellin
MIINHNISAMNTNRMFANSVKKMDSKLETLSSGQRINKGADDPAGLAVSEKMRAQVRGLNQASRNIQDASSLVQTTEGFLSETNSVLHRMRELSVQASNGTYTKEDRTQMAVELSEMVKEINRIHEDAKFNTVRLLDNSSLRANSFGSVDASPRNPNFTNNGLVVQSGANTDERMYVRVEEFNTFGLGLTDKPKGSNGEEEAKYANPANESLAWREAGFYNAEPNTIDSAMYLESEITPPVNSNVTGFNASSCR